MAKDILDLVDAQISARPHGVASLSKRGGRYEPRTWAELGAEVLEVARSLIAIGIAAGDRVGIVSNTRSEWVVLDLGIVGAGAITVPTYPSNTAAECRHVAVDAGVRLVFCEDSLQVGKFIAIRDQLPDVFAIVQMTGELERADDGVMTMASFLALGVGIDDHQLDDRRATLGPESIATIIYTAGTTGEPKGVVLTHANLLYEGRVMIEIGLVRDSDVQLLFLPLSHSFARCVAASWLASGHVLAFAENMTTIKQNLGEVRPTIMVGVPRVYEKFHAALVERGLAAPGLQGRLFARTLELSNRRGELELQGRPLGPIDALMFGLLRRVVLGKVHAALMKVLGGRMRAMLSGGAPLSIKIAWFFRDAGVELLEGYGLTETTAGTVLNRVGANQIGTVGLPMPGTELRIAADGEVLIRGPGVMREYWRSPEATAEVMDGEWFRTGDIGEIDPRTGALRITDRKKDLIKTSGGKYIAPQKLENLVKSDPLVSYCVVHGDRRPYLTALITLDEPALREFASKHGLQGSYAELTQRPEVRAEVDAIVGRVNHELARYETIKKFAILSTDFSIETGELTPKLSVRRKRVYARFAAILDAMYD